MRRQIQSSVERWPLARPFRISRGVRDAAELISVVISDAGATGRGESAPYPRYGETGESVQAQIASVYDAVANGLTRTELANLLPPGAARNAVDCALWDLESALSGTSVATTLGQPALAPLVTAITIGLDTPEKMAAETALVATSPLLKIKVDASAPADCLRAVRAAAPDAKLIVDPNESWDIGLLSELQPLLKELRVDFVEQPLPADHDASLADLDALVPNCADESCHTSADLDRLVGVYDIVNIKLDKTGGLTEAVRTLQAARERDFGVMVGCMICTSLSIAPAYYIAAQADYVDLDGPLWMKEDRPNGVTADNGMLSPVGRGFWGNR